MKWQKILGRLLTNRKHGGKTKSVSVLRAALENKKPKDGKIQMLVNDGEEEGTEKE